MKIMFFQSPLIQLINILKLEILNTIKIEVDLYTDWKVKQLNKEPMPNTTNK